MPWRPKTRIRRRVAATAAAIAGAVLLGVLAVTFRPAPTATRFIEEADAFEAKGDLISVERSLRAAIDIDPGHAMARERLARLYLRLGHGYAARVEFEHVIAQGLGDKDANENLLKAQLLSGEHLDVINALDRDPARAGSMALTVLYAEAQTALEEYSAAEGTLDGAARKFGKTSEIQRAKVSLALAQRQVARAQSIFDATSELAESTARNLRLQGELALASRDAAKALTAFEASLKEDAYSLDGQFGVIRAQVANGNLAEAETNLKRLFEKRTRDPRISYLMGLVAYQKRDFASATANLNQVLGMVPRHLQTIALLARMHIAQTEFDAAQSLLEKALANAPEHGPSNLLLGAVFVESGQGSEAITLLTPFVERGSRAPALYLLLGRAYSSTGEADDAFEYTVRGHLLAGDLEAARQVTTDFAREHPSATSPLIYLGVIRERENDEVGARATYEEALLLDGDDPAGALSLARLDAKDGDIDAARTRYERVLATRPNELAALLGLANVRARAGDRAHAIELLERARKLHPNALAPRLRLSAHHLAAGQAELALTTAREAVRINRNNPLAALGLARANAAAGATSAALRTLDALLKERPRFVQARALQGRLLLRLGRAAEARESFQRAIETNPRHLPSRATLTRLEIQTRNFDVAQTLIDQIIAEQPDRALGYRLAGSLHLAKGEPKLALRAYDNAFERSPTSRLLLARAAAHRASGEQDMARELLAGWLKQHPEDTLVRFNIAESAQRDGRVREAEQAYRALLKTNANFVPALNNLGMLLLSADEAASKNLIARAYELEPNNPVVMDSYGWVLILDDRIEDAITLLRKTVRQAPNLPDAKYHLAVAFSRANLTASARRLLEEVTADGVQFGERSEAEALLNQLKDK